MKTLLAIGLSPRYEHSTSRKLTAAVMSAVPTNEATKREQVARWFVFSTSAMRKSRQSR